MCVVYLLAISYSDPTLMRAASENWKMSEKRTGYNMHWLSDSS